MIEETMRQKTMERENSERRDGQSPRQTDNLTDRLSEAENGGREIKR